MASDIYVEKLKDGICQLEQIYGLTGTLADGTVVIRADIVDVIAYVGDLVRRISDQQRIDRNTAAGHEVVLLTYINGRLNYFDKSRLDYTVYPRIDVISDILLDFRKKSTVSEDALRSINKIVTIMRSIDAEYVNYRFGLAYRFLRIFIVMIMHGNYCNASMIADIIISQIVIEN